MLIEILGIIGGVVTIIGGAVGIASSVVTMRKDVRLRTAETQGPLTIYDRQVTSHGPPKPPPTGATKTKVTSHPNRTNVGWSIASIFFCWPLAIPAIIYAVRARKAIAGGDNLAGHRAYLVSRRWSTAAAVYIGGYLTVVAILALSGKLN